MDFTERSWGDPKERSNVGREVKSVEPRAKQRILCYSFITRDPRDTPQEKRTV